MRGGYYHTGDVASRDSDGYLTYVGRTDDVFNASGHRNQRCGRAGGRARQPPARWATPTGRGA
jgi:AMP-binding enzyme